MVDSIYFISYKLQENIIEWGGKKKGLGEINKVSLPAHEFIAVNTKWMEDIRHRTRLK